MFGRHTMSLLIVSLFALFVTSPAVADPAAEVPSVIERDRQRIQAHLEQVEAELRSRDVSHLSAEQRAARERNLDRLHAYWKAGEFPHNTHVAWKQPVFLDRDGRACAVAHLMIESGWDAQAQAISERENLAYLPDMESAEVAQWVRQSGLTAEEAAWIQPSYNSCATDCSCEAQPVCGDDGKTYVNKCFAQNCGGVQKWRDGCCAPGDEIESTRSDGYGALQGYCENDPNDRADELCPASTGNADAGSDADVWHTADTGSSDSGSDDAGCSAAGGQGPSGAWLAAVVLLGMCGLRRRV